MPITAKRNAYGRQLGSFFTTNTVKGIGEIPMTFLRAPYVSEVSDGVEVLAEVDGKIVGVKYGNQLAFAFHPELNDDLSIHKAFIDLIPASIPEYYPSDTMPHNQFFHQVSVYIPATVLLPL